MPVFCILNLYALKTQTLYNNNFIGLIKKIPLNDLYHLGAYELGGVSGKM